jgi:phosphatidylglycerol---prolipoprotein diacylglyceryl transferase
MIDPVIFSVPLGSFVFELRWYGVFVTLGMVVGAWFAAREVVRRGEKDDFIWDALLYMVIAGIVGARLWYVANATLGGNSFYMQNPLEILMIWKGGLHFFGGLLFGALALLWYARQNRLDLWLFLDAIAPMTLIGQAIARPANFINQELYGPPTDLPWGIPIEAASRIPLYKDLTQFPVETTRFHPVFAYEMLWNFLTAGALLWAARRYPNFFKPGAVFGWWLVIAGVGRVLIELFRPDQPRIPGTDVSFTTLVSLLMAIAGGVFLLVRYGKLTLAQFSLPEAYKLAPAKSAAGKLPRKKKERRG